MYRGQICNLDHVWLHIPIPQLLQLLLNLGEHLCWITWRRCHRNAGIFCKTCIYWNDKTMCLKNRLSVFFLHHEIFNSTVGLEKLSTSPPWDSHPSVWPLKRMNLLTSPLNPPGVGKTLKKNKRKFLGSKLLRHDLPEKMLFHCPLDEILRSFLRVQFEFLMAVFSPKSWSWSQNPLENKQYKGSGGNIKQSTALKTKITLENPHVQ